MMLKMISLGWSECLLFNKNLNELVEANYLDETFLIVISIQTNSIDLKLDLFEFVLKTKYRKSTIERLKIIINQSCELLNAILTNFVVRNFALLNWLAEILCVD